MQHFHCEPQFDGCEATVLASVAVAFPVNADEALADASLQSPMLMLKGDCGEAMIAGR